MDQNSNYQTPVGGGAYPPTEVSSVMSVKDWLITLLVLNIPCVGIIMMFVWAFTEGNVTRKNFCLAYLILTAIAIGLVILFYVVMFAIVGVSMMSLSDYF